MKLTTIAVILGLTASTVLQAQDSTGMKTKMFQAGFVTPLGTNGLHSWNVINQFSVNLLAGYAGGIHGVEFSGLGSVLKENMTGAQFSGLGNIVLNKTRGAQFSGLFNIGLDSVKATQFAGLVNMGRENVKAAQFAGLVNIATGQVKGFQVAGMANVTAGQAKGLQIAGFLNVSSGRFSGTQISGFMNYSDKLKGTQIGVINFVDSLEHGVPVGFLSFVKNGYTAFEVGVSETLYGVMSFKTGTKKFYNILSVGGGSHDGLSLFAWGYGLGAFIPLGKKTGLSVDGICYQVNEGEWFTKRLNLLNKLNLSASWQVAPHLSVFGGLSWNVTVSDITDEYGDKIIPHIAPWSVFDETYDDHLNVKMYPGITAGIRI